PAADARHPPIGADELPALRLIVAFAGEGAEVADPFVVDPLREGLRIECDAGSIVFLPGEARTVTWALAEARRAGVLRGRPARRPLPPRPARRPPGAGLRGVGAARGGPTMSPVRLLAVTAAALLLAGPAQAAVTRVTGQVIDGETQKPIANAEVELQNQGAGP